MNDSDTEKTMAEPTEVAGTDGDNTSAASDALPAAEKKPVKSSSRDGRSWLRVATYPVAAAVVIVVLIVVIGVLGWRLSVSSNAKNKDQAAISELHDNAAAVTRAEKVALDYGAGAANMSYTDIPGWTNRLTANCVPDLAATLKQAASATEQVIVPLQWVSSPTPLAAKVRSNNNGVYTVLAFVGITTKSTQTPDGIQSTAVYTVDVDSNRDWSIVNVGGAASAVSPTR